MRGDHIAFTIAVLTLHGDGPRPNSCSSRVARQVLRHMPYTVVAYGLSLLLPPPALLATAKNLALNAFLILVAKSSYRATSESAFEITANFFIIVKSD